MKLISVIALLLGLFVTQAGAGLISSEQVDATHCGLKAARLIENSATGAVIFPDAPGSCADSDDALSEESKSDAMSFDPTNGFADRESSVEMATLSSAVNQ
jgi:hypothetical protein